MANSGSVRRRAEGTRSLRLGNKVMGRSASSAIEENITNINTVLPQIETDGRTDRLTDKRQRMRGGN